MKSNLQASCFLLIHSSGLMAPREVLTGNGECGPRGLISSSCLWARKIELVSLHYKGGPISQSS